MRSYLMSLTLVACVLGGYTAMVISSKKTEAAKPQAAATAESRDPAAATVSTTN